MHVRQQSSRPAVPESSQTGALTILRDEVGALSSEQHAQQDDLAGHTATVLKAQTTGRPQGRGCRGHHRGQRSVNNAPPHPPQRSRAALGLRTEEVSLVDSRAGPDTAQRFVVDIQETDGRQVAPWGTRSQLSGCLGNKIREGWKRSSLWA